MILVDRLREGIRSLRALAQKDKKLFPALAVFAVVTTIYVGSKARDHPRTISSVEPTGEFKDSRILNFLSLEDGKEAWLSKKAGEVLQTQQALKTEMVTLQEKVTALESRLPSPTPTPNPNAPTPTVEEAIRLHPGATSKVAPLERSSVHGASRSSRSLRTASLGPSLISFPVEATAKKDLSVVLPAGSYVKGKLLTGVEAPEGKTYPVLVQLDFAYIVPNHHRLDLSGCFLIVKATGNLSIERVEMQATKLSCVSQNGQMFERDVSAFIADDKDQSFAVVGSVNSKQDRVASVAFLASLVEGIGKAIQQAQTTQQTTSLGGSQSVLTGNDAKYIGAGSAANAAGMVTQWYLRQAQNLLPTINVGSGRDIWVVMQESVSLPPAYFAKSKKGDSGEVPTYFSRWLD